MASAWLEDRSTTPARSTRVPARARRQAETAFDDRTRSADRAPVPNRLLPGPTLSARSALPAPARPAADRMARAVPSPRVPPPAGAHLIWPVLPVAPGPRNRARGAGAAGATGAATAGARAVPVAPAVAVAPALAASAGQAATGAGVAPAVRGDPMTRGARPSPTLPAVVAVARTTPAVVGDAAGTRSAA
jgi:hypothetical protein